MTKKEPFLWNHDYYYYITHIIVFQSFLTNRMQNYLSAQGQNRPWQKISQKGTCCSHEPLTEDRPG